MTIRQSGIFRRSVKKLSPQQKLKLDEAIRKIVANPENGEKKKGDLQNVFFFKFEINDSNYLLAYSFSSEVIDLIMLGPHENYYRDLKNYLDS
jgi:mRNA-degrading endonuclease RelE of RelBE toxin-antitoxin system